MAEAALQQRKYPVINKRAFIYLFKKEADESLTEVQVGQFEDWGVNNSVNTLQYLECGYLTPLNVPLDYSFGGYLSKGVLDSKLVAMAFNPKALQGASQAVPDGDVFVSGTITPYGALPMCSIKLVLQYSDTTDDLLGTGTEVVYEYTNCVLFNHRINNARGIVTESLAFVAQEMNLKQQPSQGGRGG